MLDLPSRFDEIASATRDKVGEEFYKYGLELVDFFINAITPPEEVQKAIDTRSSMGAISDLRAFTMYQAANSMAKMAEQSGGEMGGNAMGMGMGAGFGMMMPAMIQQAMQGAVGAPAPPVSRGTASTPSEAAPSGGLDFDALAKSTTDPKPLVRRVAESASWQVQEAEDVWHITVPVGPLRKQTVTVNFGAKDEEGHPVIAYSSVCGPASERNAMLLLRFNQQMVHGAFAVRSTPSGDVVVVLANQLADTADPLEVTRLVTAVAWQADKAEEKLVGGDEH
jgi:hypothetical protein